MPSGNSPIKAATAVMGVGGRRVVGQQFIFQGRRRWLGCLFIHKILQETPVWSLKFPQQHILNIGCTTL